MNTRQTCAISGLLFLLALGASAAFGDEKPVASAPASTGGASDTTGLQDDGKTRLLVFQIALDSVYTEINDGYFIVQPMLENSCYDCHSVKTDYPWYYEIPGIKGWIQGHIDDGLKHVDYTNGFPFGGRGSQLKILQEIREEVEEGEMPIFSYRIMHWGKLIEGDDQKALFAWIDDAVATINETYRAFGVQPPGDEDSEGGEGDHDDDDDDDD